MWKKKKCKEYKKNHKNRKKPTKLIKIKQEKRNKQMETHHSATPKCIDGQQMTPCTSKIWVILNTHKMFSMKKGRNILWEILIRDQQYYK